MNVYELVKIIFNWFMSILVGLFLIFPIGFFAVIFHMLVSRLFGSSSNLKRTIVRILTIIFVVGMISLLIWAIPLAPRKDLIFITKEVPRLDDPNNTSPAYLIYYVWDGNREEIPWWIIFERPLHSGGSEWAVSEVADVRDVYDEESFSLDGVIESASKFDKNWFIYGMHRVKRSRVQGLRHMLFGVDIFEKEEKIVKQVLSLIESKKK